MQEKQYERMLNMPIKQLLIRMALPSMLGLMITSICSLFDAFFVARIGESEAERTASVAAVGVMFSVMALAQAIGYTLGIGGGCVVSRLLGQKKKEEADAAASFAWGTALGLGALVTALGFMYFDRIPVLLGAEGDVLFYAYQYSTFIYLAVPLTSLNLALNSILRAEGKTSYAMTGLIVGGILNVILDYVLIFFFGLGIRGASLATLISQASSVGLFLLFYLRKRTVIQLWCKRKKLTGTLLCSVLSAGIPSLFRQGFAFLSNLFFSRSAAHFGSAAVSAVTVSFRIFMIFFSVALGIGQGYQPIVGYNDSAKEYGRVKEAFVFSLLLGTGVMAGLGVVLVWLAPQLLPFFIRKGDATLDIAKKILEYQAISLPFIPLNIVMNMTFQASGKKWKASFLTSCRQGVVLLPLLAILPKWFGIIGLQAVQATSDIVTFVLTIPFAVCFYRDIFKRSSQTAFSEVGSFLPIDKAE